MAKKVLIDDLNNCLIKFDRKVVVNNLLDEYDGSFEEIGKTVNEYLLAEEAKGKKFLKSFLLRGLQPTTGNEVVTLVTDEKLQQRREELKETNIMLYSAEIDKDYKAPPPPSVASVPLQTITIIYNGMMLDLPPIRLARENASPMEREEDERKERAQRNYTLIIDTIPDPNARRAMTGTVYHLIKKDDKNPNVLKMTPAFGRPRLDLRKKEPKNDKEEPKNDKEEPKNEKEEPKNVKAEPPATISSNLEDSSSSNDDPYVVTHPKDEDENKPSTSNKRRRIIDSDEEYKGPEVKVERKEDNEEVVKIEDNKPKSSETFMDEDGFIVTVKPKKNPPMKVEKKESPKSPAKKEAESKTPAAKKKQGNIMSYFTKK